MLLLARAAMVLSMAVSALAVHHHHLRPRPPSSLPLSFISTARTRGSRSHHIIRQDYHWRLFGGRRRRSSSSSSRNNDNEGNNNLSWESFEFGTSPKWDPRFESSQTVVAANAEELDVIVQQEASKDRETATALNDTAEAWKRLSPTLVQEATDVLLPYINTKRVERIEAVLRQRTHHTRFLFENPSNPSNIWACLRTLDSFGIQHVDCIIDSGRYKGKAAISQKRGMRVAMGSAQWLTLRNHPTTRDAVETLRSEHNCRLYATDLNPTSRDIRSMLWDGDDDDENDDRPICIVMGNEETGISEEMRSLVDETFTLPMCGFAESFNLSVATAITLAHLSAASSGSSGAGAAAFDNDKTRTTVTTKRRVGPLRHGDLPEHEYNFLLLKGLVNSVPQKRMARALLKKAGIELPDELNLL